MSDDMSAKLSRIRESAAHLNELCDQGAESVRTLEEFLANECSVGVEAEVNVRSESNEYSGSSFDLCYGRYGMRFRVYLRWTDSDDPEISTKTWAESKRSDKLDILPLLPELVGAIDAQLQLRIEKAREAVSLVKHLTSSSVKTGGTNAKK